MLSEDKKKKITNSFLDTIAKDLLKEHLNNFSRRKILRNCFRKALPDNKYKLNKVYKSLRSKKFSGTLFHEYDCLGLTLGNVTPSLCNKIRLGFVNNLINNLSLSDLTFEKMQKITNSFPLFIKHYAIKHAHHLGTIWIVVILLVSLVIPNHAINLTGITFGNALLYTGDFLVLQFENLINPALIGRLLINIIGDIPVVKHYFLKKN